MHCVRNSGYAYAVRWRLFHLRIVTTMIQCYRVTYFNIRRVHCTNIYSVSEAADGLLILAQINQIYLNENHRFYLDENNAHNWRTASGVCIRNIFKTRFTTLWNCNLPNIYFVVYIESVLCMVTSFMNGHRIWNCVFFPYDSSGLNGEWLLYDRKNAMGLSFITISSAKYYSKIKAKFIFTYYNSIFG